MLQAPSYWEAVSAYRWVMVSSTGQIKRLICSCSHSSNVQGDGGYCCSLNGEKFLVQDQILGHVIMAAKVNKYFMPRSTFCFIIDDTKDPWTLNQNYQTGCRYLSAIRGVLDRIILSGVQADVSRTKDIAIDVKDTVVDVATSAFDNKVRASCHFWSRYLIRSHQRHVRQCCTQWSRSWLGWYWRDCGQYHTSVYTLAVQKRSGTLWAGRMWRENVTSTPWDFETIYSFRGLLNKLDTAT